MEKYEKVDFDIGVLIDIVRGDVTGNIETADHLPVRILCTNLKGAGYPIVAAVETAPNQERVFLYNENGQSNVTPYVCDLIINVCTNID